MKECVLGEVELKTQIFRTGLILTIVMTHNKGRPGFRAQNLLDKLEKVEQEIDKNYDCNPQQFIGTINEIYEEALKLLDQTFK